MFYKKESLVPAGSYKNRQRYRFVTPMPYAGITGIDTHAHIFRQDLPMVPGRRYSPSYDATVEQYLAHLAGR